MKKVNIIPSPSWGGLGRGGIRKIFSSKGVRRFRERTELFLQGLFLLRAFLSKHPREGVGIRYGRLGLLVVLLALSGCGFRPIYGSHGAESGSPVAMDLNNIAIANIPDRKGQLLRNNLIDRMYGKNRPLTPLYTLSVSVRSEEQSLGILANASATRQLLDAYGSYSLVDASGKEILRGTAHSVASFDKLDQMYGSVAAREDAYQRTMHEISEQIVNRLSLYFSERR